MDFAVDDMWYECVLEAAENASANYLASPDGIWYSHDDGGVFVANIHPREIAPEERDLEIDRILDWVRRQDFLVLACATCKTGGHAYALLVDAGPSHLDEIRDGVRQIMRHRPDAQGHVAAPEDVI